LTRFLIGTCECQYQQNIESWTFKSRAWLVKTNDITKLVHVTRALHIIS